MVPNRNQNRNRGGDRTGTETKVGPLPNLCATWQRAEDSPEGGECGSVDYFDASLSGFTFSMSMISSSRSGLPSAASLAICAALSSSQLRA